jgi:hypothetical protein
MHWLLHILHVETKPPRFPRMTYLRVLYGSHNKPRLNLSMDVTFVPDYGGGHAGRWMKSV